MGEKENQVFSGRKESARADTIDKEAPGDASRLIGHPFSQEDFLPQIPAIPHDLAIRLYDPC